MTIESFEGIRQLSLIVTILVVVGIFCYLWYLYVNSCANEDNQNTQKPNYYHYEPKKEEPKHEEPKKEIKEEPKVEPTFIPKESNTYKLSTPYYPIRERISYGFDEPEKDISPIVKRPQTKEYTIDTTGKRNLTETKLCILLLDKLGTETIQRLEDKTIITINGTKKITKQSNGRKYSIPTTFMTTKTTKEKLLELNDSNEMKQHERNKVTPKLREMVKIRDNYTCQICGKHMPDNVGLHIDHIIPINKGGKSVMENLQVLCSVCNGRKSDKVEGE